MSFLGVGYMIRVLVILMLLLVPAASAQTKLQNLSDECALQFECQKANNGYWFDCRYEINTSGCRCFVGDFSSCNISRSSVKSAVTNSDEKSSPGITALTMAKSYSVKVVNIIVGASLRAKVLILALVVMLLALVIFLVRDNTEKNLKRAIRYHKAAEEAYKKGDSEKSEKYHELSNYYREKAHENED
jgi:hypothetical protein